MAVVWQGSLFGAEAPAFDPTFDGCARRAGPGAALLVTLTLESHESA